MFLLSSSLSFPLSLSLFISPLYPSLLLSLSNTDVSSVFSLAVHDGRGSEPERISPPVKSRPTSLSSCSTHRPQYGPEAINLQSSRPTYTRSLATLERISKSRSLVMRPLVFERLLLLKTPTGRPVGLQAKLGLV